MRHPLPTLPRVPIENGGGSKTVNVSQAPAGTVQLRWALGDVVIQQTAGVTSYCETSGQSLNLSLGLGFFSLTNWG